MAEKEQVENDVALAYLRRVADLKKLTPTEIARKAGLNASTLTGFMGSNPRVKSIRRTTLEMVAQSTGIPLPQELIAATKAVRLAGTSLPHDVPIHGLIGALSTDGYYWNPVAIDFAPRPPGIAHASRAIAFRMPDETMDGWRRPNELVFVDPMRTVAEGDHALVEMTNTLDPDGQNICVIRRVLQRQPGGVTLASWGLKPSELQIQRTKVLQFHRVMEWPELLGT